MKKLILTLIAVVVLAASAVPAGFAWDQPAPPKKHHHHHKPTPDPTPVPPVEQQITQVGYCLLTVEYGPTYFNLAAGSLDVGQPWWVLYNSSAKVSVDGKTVTLNGAAGPAGIRYAPVVPGVGGTCDQPFVK